MELYTEELQWLAHLWTHENMFESGYFELMSVNHSTGSGSIIGMSVFSIFFTMKVCFVFSLESPHRGDSNEYTQYTIFNINKTITLIYPKSASLGFFFWGLKNEFETAMVNEPLVFAPLKICSMYLIVMLNGALIATVKILINAAVLLNARCLLSENNVI